jgi:tetratricopeptide (TPR) repeat protein
MTTASQVPAPGESELALHHAQSAIAYPQFIPLTAQSNLARMFRDPYLLEEGERLELIEQLREAVALNPEVSQLRVLMGMALCVNYEAQTALEELREAVRLAPDSFIAHLKFGELLMRLRICTQAQEETRAAAELAATPLQSELARRQAATIRKMMQEGIERGGYGKLLSIFSRAGRLFPRPQLARRNEAPAGAALDSSC